MADTEEGLPRVVAVRRFDVEAVDDDRAEAAAGANVHRLTLASASPRRSTGPASAAASVTVPIASTVASTTTVPSTRAATAAGG